jgi:hypothetical protein
LIGHIRRAIWRWSTIGIIICAVFMTACGGEDDNANTGIDLGSGQLLAFIGRNGNLYFSRADGSSMHAVTTATCENICYGPPSWSHKGQHVALFGPRPKEQNESAIFIYNRQSVLEKTILPPDPLSFGEILWSPDDTLIAYQGRPQGNGQDIPPLSMLLFNVKTGTSAGNVTIPQPSGDQGVVCPDENEGGPLVSMIDRAINGNNGARLTLDWSHDGQQFLVASGRCFTGISLVQRSNSSSTTIGDSSYTQGAFSPDGSHIALIQFVSDGSSANLIVTDSAGKNPKTFYTDTATPPPFTLRLSAPIWSDDGQRVYFAHGVDLWVVNSDGNNPHQLLGGTSSGNVLKAISSPSSSTDGQHLAWIELVNNTQNNILKTTLYTGTPDAQKPIKIAEDAWWPNWS